MGLVKLVDHTVKLQCELYRSYFSPLLELECGQTDILLQGRAPREASVWRRGAPQNVCF